MTLAGPTYYKAYANRLPRIKNLAKKLYYDSAITDKKDNPRELWKKIKSVITSKPSYSSNSSLSNIRIQDETTNDPETFVNILMIIL